uniref:MOSC domain-containing protein n=1 Tax=Strigamia maritima TaxID=126957 RepID=T1J360_STRMM
MDRSEWLRVGAVGAAAFLTGACGSLYAANTWRKPNIEYHQVGTLSNLLIYPIKSCRPIRVDEAECTQLGLKLGNATDRSFMLTDGKYHFITGRKENRMVLVQPTLKNDTLLLDAPGMETFELKIPEPKQVARNAIQGQQTAVFDQKTFGVDCGDQVGAWFGRFLERAEHSTRLLYHPWDESVRHFPYWHFWERYREDDRSKFADLNAFMALSEGSLNDLNERLGQQFSFLNFRPNFTVRGPYPYEEDAWKYLKIGETSFRCTRPCTRCVFTTIDPETGIKGDEPLKTLRRYRRHPDPRVRKREGDAPMFGTHLGLNSTSGSVIRVGDPVLASY